MRNHETAVLRKGGDKIRHRKRRTDYAAAVLLCLVLITTFLLGGLAAQFRGTSAKKEEARVAVMAADVIADIPVSVGYPGAEEVIPVTLTNYEGSSVCDVAQKYSFSLEKMTDNLPLTVELYSDKNCSTPMNAENGVYSGEDFVFPAGEKTERTCYLKITWQEDKKDPNLSFEIDYLRIRISSEQID